MYSRAIKHASMCNQLIRSAEREEMLKILGRCYVTCCRQCSGPETGLRNTVRYKSCSPKGHQRLREHPVCIPIRGISSSPWHQVFAKDLFLGKFNKVKKYLDSSFHIYLVVFSAIVTITFEWMDILSSTNRHDTTY